MLVNFRLKNILQTNIIRLSDPHAIYSTILRLLEATVPSNSLIKLCYINFYSMVLSTLNDLIFISMQFKYFYSWLQTLLSIVLINVPSIFMFLTFRVVERTEEDGGKRNDEKSQQHLRYEWIKQRNFRNRITRYENFNYWLNSTQSNLSLTPLFFSNGC